MRLPEGYTFRVPFDSDAAGIAELANLNRLKFVGDQLFTAARVRDDWATPRFDRNRNVRVVHDGIGKLVGTIKIWDTETPPVFMWIPGMVHSEHQGKGIGANLLDWVEHRARESIDRCPADSRVSVLSVAYRDDVSAAKILQSRGYEHIRTDWRMQIDLDQPIPEPVWPDGITLQTYRHPEMLREVVLADKEAFRDHHGFVEENDEEELADREHEINTNTDFDAQYWKVARAGTDIAGLCLTFSKFHGDETRGYVDSLGVLPAFRRQGLGLALLRDTFQRLQRAGLRSCVLGVDAGSLTGAQRLYQKAGMRTVVTSDMYELELRPGRDMVRKD